MKRIIIVYKMIHADSLFITGSKRQRISLDMNPSLLLYGFRENKFFFTFLGLGDEKPGWLVIGEFDIGIAPGRF